MMLKTSLSVVIACAVLVVTSVGVPDSFATTVTTDAFDDGMIGSLWTTPPEVENGAALTENNGLEFTGVASAASIRGELTSTVMLPQDRDWTVAVPMYMADLVNDAANSFGSGDALVSTLQISPTGPQSELDGEDEIEVNLAVLDSSGFGGAGFQMAVRFASRENDVDEQVIELLGPAAETSIDFVVHYDADTTTLTGYYDDGSGNEVFSVTADVSAWGMAASESLFVDLIASAGAVDGSNTPSGTFEVAAGELVFESFEAVVADAGEQIAPPAVGGGGPPVVPPTGALTCTHPAGGFSFLMGDVNGTGAVNVADAVCAINASLELQGGGSLDNVGCLASAPNRLYADLSCDNSVDVSDVLAVINMALDLGLPSGLNPGSDGCPAACVDCTTTGGSCLIATACVPEGDRTGSDGCQVCDPSSNPTDWTAETPITYYLDVDNDTYGVTGDTSMACVGIDPYTALVDGDCVDGDEDINPDAAEICDDVDNNCIGGIDEPFTTKGNDCDGPDSDGCENGVLVCNGAGDGVECGPESPADLVEICGNFIDDDCDMMTDEGCPTNPSGTLGSGADGPLTASGTTTINTTSTSANGTMGSNTLAVSSTAGFAMGHVVLVHQSIGTEAGNWEFAVVSAVNASSLTLLEPLEHTYVTAGNEYAQAVRVPEYTDVTVPSGATLTAPGWGGNTGGILAFFATGTVDVASGGTIAMNGGGFRGGFGGASNGGGGGGGESYVGFGAQGAQQQSCSRGPGGGSGDTSCSAVAGGIGAGGGGGDSAANSDDGGGGGGGGGHAGGGGGGAAGGGCSATGGGPGGAGGAPGQNAGGGGGSNCPGGAGGSAGSNGGPPNGGSAGSGTTGGGGGGSQGNNYGGGGGGGGGRIGDDALSQIYFGGGGAGGGGSLAHSNQGGLGGPGGGIVFVTAATVRVDGSIVARGADGQNPNVSYGGGCGGSGAGGSVFIQTLNIQGAGSLNASGGAVCNPSGGPSTSTGGGGGGAGRIRVESGAGSVPSASPSATTDSFNTSSVLGGSDANPGDSCLDIHTMHPELSDGWYWIDPDGAMGLAAFLAYCDMTTDSGGWTLIASLRPDELGSTLLTDAVVGTTSPDASTTGKLHSDAFTALVTGSSNFNPIKFTAGSTTKYFGNGGACRFWIDTIDLAYQACVLHFSSQTATSPICEGDLQTACNYSDTSNPVATVSVYDVQILGARANGTSQDIMLSASNAAAVGATENQGGGRTGVVWIR